VALIGDAAFILSTLPDWYRKAAAKHPIGRSPGQTQPQRHQSWNRFNLLYGRQLSIRSATGQSLSNSATESIGRGEGLVLPRKRKSNKDANRLTVLET